MGSIDKIFISSIAEFDIIYEWCNNNNNLFSVEYPHGNFFDYFYELDRLKVLDMLNSSKSGIIPIINAPKVMNYYLIRNCDIPFIVARLKEQYMDYELIKKKKDKDIFEISTKFKIIPLRKNDKKINCGNKRGFKYKYTIDSYTFDIYKHLDDLYNFDMVYDDVNDAWINVEDDLPSFNIFTTYYVRYGYSLKSLLRKFRKWKLPKGIIMRVSGYYVNQEYLIYCK